MIDRDAWACLHAERFSQLPFDCGNSVDPGLHEVDDLRDWSRYATTPDQLRMEDYIDRFDLSDKRILHIGIGNSGLARRFYRRAAQIVGTSVDQEELDQGRQLQAPNYCLVLQNKFTADPRDSLGKFDFILDNNPTSMCCCLMHLAQLLDYYSSKLAEQGQIVSDLEGLGWTPELPGFSKRWSFSVIDLTLAAGVTGLQTHRFGKHGAILSLGQPQSPGKAAVSRHLLRKVWTSPAEAIRGCRSVLRRLKSWMQ